MPTVDRGGSQKRDSALSDFSSGPYATICSLPRLGMNRPANAGVAKTVLRLGAAEHLDWLRVKNYSEQTITNRHVYLRYFIAWCEQRGIARPADITRPILERYARYLYYYRGAKSGKPLTFRSQHARLTPVRALFKWLVRQNYLLSNPASLASGVFVGEVLT